MNNPFYETTSAQHGQHLHLKGVDLKNTVKSNLQKSALPVEKTEFSFLYNRTSDVYGVDPFKATRDADFDYSPHVKKTAIKEENSHPSVDVGLALQKFKHIPVKQNPLYATSASEIGKKPPTIATYVAERAHRSQAFSKGFNNVKPKSSSLNTGLSKSNIHPSLDPQFI